MLSVTLPLCVCCMPPMKVIYYMRERNHLIVSHTGVQYKRGTLALHPVIKVSYEDTAQRERERNLERGPVHPTTASDRPASCSDVRPLNYVWSQISGSDIYDWGNGMMCQGPLSSENLVEGWMRKTRPLMRR